MRLSTFLALALVCAGCDSDRATGDAGREDAATPSDAATNRDAGTDDAGRLVDAAVAPDGGIDDVRDAETRTEGCWSIDRVAFSSAVAIDLALAADGAPRLGLIAEGTAWIVEPAGAGRWRATRVGAVESGSDTWIALGIDGEGHSHLMYSNALTDAGARLGVAYATDASGAFVLRAIDEVLPSGDLPRRIQRAVAFTEAGAVRFVASTTRVNGVRFDVSAEVVDIGESAVGTPLLTEEYTPDRSFVDGLGVAARPGGGTWAAIAAGGTVYIAPAHEGALTEAVRAGYASHPSLVFDASGGPWVAFGDNHNTAFTDQLVVAHRDGDAWVEEIVAPPDTNIEQTASAIDASGTLHVVFGGIRHAVRASDGTWSVSTIGFGALPVLRAAGGPLHLAYVETGAIDIARCAP